MAIIEDAVRTTKYRTIDEVVAEVRKLALNGPPRWPRRFSAKRQRSTLQFGYVAAILLRHTCWNLSW